MKTIFFAAVCLIIGSLTSAQAANNPVNPLGLERASNPAKSTLNLDQLANVHQSAASPPRGLCTKADYYCSRGYQNWCEVWELNNCDEL